MHSFEEEALHSGLGLGQGRNQNDGGDAHHLGFLLEGLPQVLIQLEGFSVFLLGGLEIPDLEMPPKPPHSLRDFPLKAVDHRMPQEVEADSSRRA